MALSKAKAVEAARAIIQEGRAEEMPRLDRIHRALQPHKPGDPARVGVPNDAPEILRQLAIKSETNFLPLVVETFSQAKVDGYYSSTDPTRTAPAWRWWQKNRMDARQTGIHRSATTYGGAYATVLPGDTGPVIKGYSPRRMTAVYSDLEDEWPMMGLDVDGRMLKLFDEEQVYYIGAENPLRSGFGSDLMHLGAADLQYIEARTHGSGATPIVRFRDRMLLEGEEQFGIVEPLMTIQGRLDETIWQTVSIQFVAAFKQRYVTGWVPESEADQMAMGASEAWFFKDDNVKVGQFEESDLTRLLESKDSALRDLSAIGQIPAQNLGVKGISNISSETLAALEAGKDRKQDEITTSLGESWEQVMRLSSHLEGDIASAEDYSGEVRWKDATARSFAQTVDGLGKIGTMLHVPDEILWEQIPGWTPQMIERAKVLRKQADSMGELQRFLEAEGNDEPGR